MSFLSSIKHYFGFGPDHDPTDPLYADTVPEQNNTPQAATIAPVSSRPVEFDPAMHDAIFTRVIEVFDSALPDFLARSVDPAAQRRLLREALDEGIQTYLNSLTKAAADFSESQWLARQADMNSQIEAIKIRADEVETRSKDLQQKQLSADRQKRALTERVHELEGLVGRLESEREQFELENRSLMNRLKVATVHQDEINKLTSDLEAAQAEVSRLRNNPDTVADERIADAEKRLKEQTDRADALAEALNNANDTISLQKKEIADLNELVAEFDAATLRMEKSDSLIKEQQETIATLKTDIADRDEQIVNLNIIIADNLKRSTEREQMLRSEIDELRPMHMASTSIDFVEEDVMLRLSDDDLSTIPVAEEPHPYQSTPADSPIAYESEAIDPATQPESKTIDSDVKSITDSRRGRQRQRKPSGSNEQPSEHPGQLSLF